MSKPNIQIDDEVREMTDEEYEALLATGWTMGEPEPVAEEPGAVANFPNPPGYTEPTVDDAAPEVDGAESDAG
jgi:hypothetical protein